MTRSEAKIVYSLGKGVILGVLTFCATSIHNGDLLITNDADGFNISYNKHISLTYNPKQLNK